MTKRMLIDATHAEETRVVVLDGNRLEDFDVETSTKRQLKGNIYLAKVVRVEPSLQAAFVEYGGNRHGFLAFSEIHPDYYQIPVADRQRLLDQEAEEARREEEEVDRELEGGQPRSYHERTPDLAPVETSPDGTPAQTSEPRDEPEAMPSGATTEMLHDSLAGAAPEAAATDTNWAPQEPDDSIGGGAAAALGDQAPSSAATAPASDLGDGVTGAAGLSPVEAVQQPADPVPSSAADVTAGVPAETAASSEASTAATPVEAPSTELAPEAPALGTPSAATEPAASEPAASEHAASVDAPPAHDAPGHGGSGHGGSAEGAADQPEHSDPSTRRAQPMVIEHQTLSGPVETGTPSDGADELPLAASADTAADTDTEQEPGDYYSDSIPESPPPETVGGEPDSADEQRERRPPSRYLRNYKIQEVIRRRQILLVQVVKEERGTKGAALTTYMSLAGRFSVLMPNSPRGGGISRKITSASDRRRLKEAVAELEMPKGMGLIVRTAGANRPKPEIKRDCEYLLRLWDDIREHTLKSVAPALIYEEASLIKRAIRDVYSRDIDEIQVDGEEGWRAAHEFMRMLMPSHAKKVIHWRDQSQPLFAKYQVEAQLDGMLQPTVQLRSGGYLVINQAEALVAIDVNSGRSTRERNVEETALRTNLEAADEVARQLRLRDLAGLIVIDFIDMEQKKHNSMVERRMKEALKNDRARIQVGHISHFGLLEMSRQRLRPSLAEASFILCPHCGGTGHVRSTENAAIHVLRGIEDEGSKRRAAEIVVYAATPIALYILNHKRERLGEIERRYAMGVTVLGDDTQVASQYRIDRVRPQVARDDSLTAITPDAPPVAALPAPRWDVEDVEEAAAADEPDADEVGSDDTDDEENGADERGGETARQAGVPETAEEKEQAERRRRRRRRRRGGRREDGPAPMPADAGSAPVLAGTEDADAPAQMRSEEGAAGEEESAAPDMHIEGVPEHTEPAIDDEARRRRGRRGGRRRRREPGDGEASPFAAPGAEQPELPQIYIGPTPANPFGGHAFDIFDVLEQVEASAAVRQEATDPALRQPLIEPDAMETPGEPEAATALTIPEFAAAVVEAERVAAPVETGAPVETETPAASTEPHGADEAPAGAIVNATAPEPGATDPVIEPAAEPMAEPAAVVATHTETGAMPASVPDATPGEVANDVAPEPAIKPIIVGSGEEPAEKKRGWWRR
jgi:ribonuclease E